MTLKVLQFGVTGQMARELIARGPRHGVQLTALSREQADLTDPAAIARIVEQADADLVINAAAYTAVDKAQAERDVAFLVNAESPGAMARICAMRGLPLVNVSTDYVFNGSGSRAWREDDATAPINAYGDSKLAGEQAIAASEARAITLRTSWVFSAHGANFVKTMLRFADRPELKVVDDQIGRPTFAGDLAEAALTVGQRLARDENAPTGLFHFAGGEVVSWHQFATAIFDAKGPPAPAILPISTRDYPTPAARPANSVLDCARIEGAFGIVPRPWRDGLNETLAQLGRS